MPINTKQLYYVKHFPWYEPFSYFHGVFDSEELAKKFINEDIDRYDNSSDEYKIYKLEINKWV